MYSGLRRCSVECIHPSQRSVSQRVMTDNIFEIETVAIAMRTCYSDDPGILLTDFSCAHSSVDHEWIFMLLERAGVTETLQFFPRWTYAGFHCECRACRRSWRAVCNDEGCTTRLPGECRLVYHGPSIPVFRWLLSSAIPPKRAGHGFYSDAPLRTPTTLP